MIKKGYITLVFSILLLFLGTLLINIKNNTLTNEAFIPAGILSVIFIVVQIISVIEVGRYIIDSKATVRKTATKFGVSKSTVHKDLTERLPQIDHHLAEEVRDILDINKSERHIRGGMATRQKYLLLHRVN